MTPVESHGKGKIRSGGSGLIATLKVILLPMLKRIATIIAITLMATPVIGVVAQNENPITWPLTPPSLDKTPAALPNQFANGFAPASQAGKSGSGMVGKPAPSLHAGEWIGGGPLSIGKLKGKVVLLDFWATWCIPCIKTFPTLRQWQTRYGPKGLVIIGMTDLTAQTSEKVRSFVQKEKLPWIVAIDPNKRTQKNYGVNALPHSIVIDKKGTVRASHVGGKSLQEIEKEIEELLGPGAN